MKKLDIQPCVHILDCAKVLVNLDNDNYENSSVVKIDGKPCAAINWESSKASWMIQA